MRLQSEGVLHPACKKELHLCVLLHFMLVTFMCLISACPTPADTPPPSPQADETLAAASAAATSRYEQLASTHAALAAEVEVLRSRLKEVEEGAQVGQGGIGRDEGRNGVGDGGKGRQRRG